MRSLGPVLVLVLLACGGPSKPRSTSPAARAPATSARAGDTKDPPPPPPDGGAPAEETFPALAEIPPSVRILDPGTAPRQKLRYKLRPGLSERLELSTRTTLGMSILSPDLSSPIMQSTTDTPTVRMTMRTTVSELTPDGTALVTYDLEDTAIQQDGKLEPNAQRVFETEIGGLAGMRGSARMSPRGEQAEVVFEMPNASPSMSRHMDNMRDSLRYMYLLLPDGEVGAGAKWEETSRIPINGVLTDRRSIYTLHRLTASTADVEVEVDVSAPRQPLKVPGGSTATLDSLTGKGSGKLALPLKQLVPTGSVSVTIEMAMTIVTGGTKTRATVKAAVTSSTRPGKPPRKAPARR
jgi:hypothetical protein